MVFSGKILRNTSGQGEISRREKEAKPGKCFFKCLCHCLEKKKKKHVVNLEPEIDFQMTVVKTVLQIIGTCHYK